MLGIGFIKAPPTTYVLHFKDGRVVREGPGLSFFYYAPTSTILYVPLSSVDVPFVFNEVTADFQNVAIQGQLTYRIADPKKVVTLLDFSVRPSGSYVSDDPKKLDERLVNLTQVLASAVTHRMTLREALVAYEALVSEVLVGLRASTSVLSLGVEAMDFSVISIKPTPETAKALEAEARELILRQADEAVYARRNSAVEQERRIKESELNTEIAVEAKRRQIRETKMTADIAVETQRSGLIERQVENERRVADTRAYALEATLRPLKEMDWRTLMAVSSGKMDPKTSIAMAFRDLAENAQKIGQLNISPDLLEALLARDGVDGAEPSQQHAKGRKQQQ
jgi:regulator of protease activity HflC (stomatin/prohibitin superfamily)